MERWESSLDNQEYPSCVTKEANERSAPLLCSQRWKAGEGFHVSCASSLKKGESAVIARNFQIPSDITNVDKIPQITKNKKRLWSVNLREAVGREVEKQTLTTDFRNAHKMNPSKERLLLQTLLTTSALLFLFLPQNTA